MMLVRLRSFSLPLTLLSIFFTSVLQGCKEDGAVLENKYLKVILLNPEHKLGCRFTRGDGSKTSALREEAKRDYLWISPYSPIIRRSASPKNFSRLKS
jgi:hypothetical protein